MERPTIEIEVDRIRPNLRLIYPRESIEQFCHRVRSGGQMDPLEVWFDGECFRIWDGEKRWRVCKILGIRRMKAFLVQFQEGTEEMENRNDGTGEWWNSERPG